MIEIEYDGLIYSLNPEEKTASVIGNMKITDEIYIPRSLYFKSVEYLITSISSGAFEMTKVKSVEFPEDSEMQIINRGAFSLSSIESISIPKKLIDLDEGWSHETSRLYKITVSPKNPRYKQFNDKIVIGKITLDSETHDILVFCSRDVQKVTIPSFITIIGSFSFAGCNQLQTVEIPSDSKLKIIGKDAFYESSFKEFEIPPSLTRICDGAFYFCTCLKTLKIPKNSKLHTIEKDVFYSSEIEQLTISAKLVDLKEGWCHGASELNKIIVDPKNPRYCFIDEKMLIGKSSLNKIDYDVLVFCARNIKTVKIPSFIKIIGPYAFSYSSIEHLELPPQITKICESAFISCEKLKTIEIPENSELQTIENEAFSCSSIECLSIPSKLVNLSDKWCYDVPSIKKIFVSPNNPKYSSIDDKMIIGKSSFELDFYDVIVFCYKDVEKIIIPSFIKSIGPFSFYECNKIRSFEFHPKSEIQKVDQYALSCSSVNCVIIPSNLNVICQYAFSSCQQLSKVIIPNNSELRFIDKYAFSWSSIGSFSIPAHLIEIGDHAFYQCRKLQIIEINENSQMDFEYFYVFFDCMQSIIMIPIELSYFYFKK